MAAVLAGLSLATPEALTTAEAATVPVVAANWQMNDGPGSRTMNDSSGNGLDGVISPDAAAQGLTSNGQYLSWTSRCPTCLPVQIGRVVQVPDDDSLDIPDPSATYTLEFRFRTTHGYGNYMQKGQSTTNGGQIKVQGPGGRVQCLFKGANGNRVGTGSPTPLDDGQWHTVRCVHTATQVKEYVDGVHVATKNGSTGPINNKQPFTLGGKKNCDQGEITCDYFAGDIDYVKVSNELPTGNVPPTATFSSNCNGLSCAFDSTGSTDPDGTIASYSWDFGDGAASTQANPTHVFPGSGPYRVTLTVTDNDGATDGSSRTVDIEGVPPGRPGSAAASAGNGSAVVSWSQPASQGTDPISQYLVTASPGGGSCTTGGVTCVVNGLTNGEVYTFTVTAQSAAGSGLPSNPTNAVTPAGPPLPPAAVKVKPGNSKVVVKWAPGGDNGSSITSYTVTQQPGARQTTVDADQHRTVFKDLKNGRAYRFTVAARNSVGTSPVATSAKVRPAARPGKVRDVRARARSGAAVLKWDAAASNGARVLRYEVDTARGRHRTTAHAALRLRFVGLKPGSQQRFRVRAVNAMGSGPWSKWSRTVSIR